MNGRKLILQSQERNTDPAQLSAVGVLRQTLLGEGSEGCILRPQGQGGSELLRIQNEKYNVPPKFVKANHTTFPTVQYLHHNSLTFTA